MNVGALLAMILLLFLNGFFVAAEFAFTAASRHQLAMRSGRSARAAVRAIDELSFTLAGAQLGITIASLLLGAVAEPAVAAVIESSIGAFVEIPERTLHTIALIVALLIVVFLHMVIGEMGPKNVAIADPERSSLLMALPFRAYSWLLRPVIWVLNEAANLVLRAVGVDPTDAKEAHTADDLASLITAGRREGIVEDFAHRLLTGAIGVWDLRADDVMVPRTDVVALPLTTTVAEVEKAVLAHGHSRIPVYDISIDEIRGFVHIKDLLRLGEGDAHRELAPSMIRPLLVVPESNPLGDLLDRMRQQRSHLALVVDEHGGTAGIVTMEDIVEEVVGEIRDEYDREPPLVRRLGSGRFVLDASLRPDQVGWLCGIDLPEGDYDTIGGLVMDRLGRIPTVGDHVQGTGWQMRVRSMDGRRIGDVELVTEPNGEK